jgi:hypothetical protein
MIQLISLLIFDFIDRPSRFITCKVSAVAPNIPFNQRVTHFGANKEVSKFLYARTAYSAPSEIAESLSSSNLCCSGMDLPPRTPQTGRINLFDSIEDAVKAFRTSRWFGLLKLTMSRKWRILGCYGRWVEGKRGWLDSTGPVCHDRKVCFSCATFKVSSQQSPSSKLG